VKIIQVTDIHIGRDKEKPYGIDVRGHYLAILEELKNEDFDFLVISGDLCFRDADENIYHWIKSVTDKLEKPYFLVPGNHDSAVSMARVFNAREKLKNQALYHELIQDDISIFFLDSGLGKISRDQLHWLEYRLENQDQDVPVFMHHPPCLANVPHMDNQYALKNWEETLGVFQSFSHQVHVFCGHYHVHKTICAANATVFITPSPFFNLRDDKEDFEIENHQACYRKIMIEKGKLLTSVKWI
jgi:Icc protein